MSGDFAQPVPGPDTAQIAQLARDHLVYICFGLLEAVEQDTFNTAVLFDRTGQISVPNRQENPIAKKHKDFFCILAGNTWGSGSVEYQGREMQDMAFLDRSKLCRIFVDYDQNIEQHIAGDHYDWFCQIRAFVKDNVDSEQFSGW